MKTLIGDGSSKTVHCHIHAYILKYMYFRTKHIIILNYIYDTKNMIFNIFNKNNNFNKTRKHMNIYNL